MYLLISKDDLDSIDMKLYSKPIEWHHKANYFYEDAGKEVYRLLTYLSKHMPSGSKIVDIGTHLGSSAAALAANKECHVTTFDIGEHIKSEVDVSNVSTIYDVKNITYIIKDCIDEISTLSTASLIYLDVDPHDGKQEIKYLQKLRDISFKGIVIMDDIALNREMWEMWNNIPERKKNITSYGHWSGTGIVYFSDDIQIDFK